MRRGPSPHRCYPHHNKAATGRPGAGPDPVGSPSWLWEGRSRAGSRADPLPPPLHPRGCGASAQLGSIANPSRPARVKQLLTAALGGCFSWVLLCCHQTLLPGHLPRGEGQGVLVGHPQPLGLPQAGVDLGRSRDAPGQKPGLGRRRSVCWYLGSSGARGGGWCKYPPLSLLQSMEMWCGLGCLQSCPCPPPAWPAQGKEEEGGLRCLSGG